MEKKICKKYNLNTVIYEQMIHEIIQILDLKEKNSIPNSMIKYINGIKELLLKGDINEE